MSDSGIGSTVGGLVGRWTGRVAGGEAGAAAGALIGPEGVPIGAVAGEVAGGRAGEEIGQKAGDLAERGVRAGLALANKMAEKLGGKTEACATCRKARVTAPDPKDPCKHLRKGDKNGEGDFRGGAHSEMKKPANRPDKYRKDSQSFGDSRMESHHIPANSANKNAGGPAEDKAAAIQMDSEDHKETESFGSKKSAQLYRKQQQDLLDKGKYLDALNMDIEDLKEKNLYNKYKNAIAEAVNYATCIQKNWDVYRTKPPSPDV